MGVAEIKVTGKAIIDLLRPVLKAKLPDDAVFHSVIVDDFNNVLVRIETEEGNSYDGGVYPRLGPAVLTSEYVHVHTEVPGA